MVLFGAMALQAQDATLFRDANGKYSYKDKTGKIPFSQQNLLTSLVCLVLK